MWSWVAIAGVFALAAGQDGQYIFTHNTSFMLHKSKMALEHYNVLCVLCIFKERFEHGHDVNLAQRWLSG